jgi:transposase, IS6 family
MGRSVSRLSALLQHSATGDHSVFDERFRYAELWFKWRHFQGEVILWVVRWYCRYGVSNRDLEQRMGERGVAVDHSPIYRWVQRYAPEIEKRLRWHWHWHRPQSTSWRVDETYIKVRGQWTYTASF